MATARRLPGAEGLPRGLPGSGTTTRPPTAAWAIRSRWRSRPDTGTVWSVCLLQALRDRSRHVFPEGSPEAQWGLLDHRGGRMPWLDPFVRDHPELRIRRRTDDVRPADATVPVRTIKLTKQDAAPTRITEDDLQIWTSPNNYRYQPTRIRFTLADTVEPAPRDVHDHRGRLLTRQGDPVRVLTLSGLDLQDKYILVTTTFKDGAPDFVNSGLELMKALDESGREIPGVFATGGAIAFSPSNDFRRAGLMYDHGFGAAAVALDAPNTSGRRGLIAFTRGRNEYLPGALASRAGRAAVLARVPGGDDRRGGDGVDFRRRTTARTPIPARVRLQRGRARTGPGRPATCWPTSPRCAARRTEFLRQCKRRLGRAGTDAVQPAARLLPSAPAGRAAAGVSAQPSFRRRRWLEEGLMDEAVLRFFSYPPSAVFDDPIAQEMIAARPGLPITVNRYVAQGFAGAT